MSKLLTRGNICLFLGRHDTTSSGMWVYSRNLIAGLLESGVRPSVVAGGSQAVLEELQGMLDADSIEFLAAGSWQRRLAIVQDLFLKLPVEMPVHGTSNLVPLSGEGKRVVTLHDLLQGYPPEGDASFYAQFKRAVYRWVYRRTASRADLILTDRGTTADEIKRVLSPSAPVVVLEPPLDQHYVQAGLPEQSLQAPECQQYRILAFAASDPRKNVSRVFEALEACQKPVHLTVLASSQEARRQVNECRADNVEVEIVSGVAASDMPELYQRQDLLVFPSLAEGFGYPAFEALSQGVPVVVPKAMVEPPLYAEVRDFLYECDPLSVLSISDAVKSAIDGEVGTKGRRQEVAEAVRRYLAPAQVASRLLSIYSQYLSVSVDEAAVG